MNKTLNYIVCTAVCALFFGCGPSNDTDTTETGQSEAVEREPQGQTSAIQIDPNSLSLPHVRTFQDHSEIKMQISQTSPEREIYLVFTNETTRIIPQSVSLSGDMAQSFPIEQKGLPEKNGFRHADKSIVRYADVLREKLRNAKPAPSVFKKEQKQISMFTDMPTTIGSKETFFLDESGDLSASVTCTLRAVQNGILTRFGPKTLLVYVADDSFDSGLGCQKRYCVTQALVDELASQFLSSGEDNDIYDWVTAVFGEEWGDLPERYQASMIGKTDTITIVLSDIGGDDNPYGGVVGYFWSKDTALRDIVPGSNERVMFYIDSVVFSNPTQESFYQKEIYSTLAHELQHVIHFYQKGLLLDTQSDVWLNEMLSESVEDLIAVKLEHIGPRGVNPLDGSAGSGENQSGRYPDFNRANNQSLTLWSYEAHDYSAVNAFGAFLLRNYGGAELLKEILYSTQEDHRAIEAGLVKLFGPTAPDFSALLREWGVSVLLSDMIDPMQKRSYNHGDFFSTRLGEITYMLGSVNFFNYVPAPLFTQCGRLQPQSNCYMRLPSGNGVIELDIATDPSVQTTLVIK